MMKTLSALKFVYSLKSACFLIFLIIFAHQCLCSVTIKDLQLAQQKIFARAHPRGYLQIIQGKELEVPSLQRLIFNTTEDDLECCIITYASYNLKYQLLLKRLINKLKPLFKGHLIYRVGGWPNMENGCLDHCDTPYAFKICAFKEAISLGYKKVLWLDVLVEPLRNLSPVFEHLENKHCVYRHSFFPFKEQINPAIINEFALSEENIIGYKHIAAGILGFNFKNPETVHLINEWHNCAIRNTAFDTNFPEQIPLSILIYKYRFENCAFDPFAVSFSKEDTKRSLFLIDYSEK